MASTDRLNLLNQIFQEALYEINQYHFIKALNLLLKCETLAQEVQLDFYFLSIKVYQLICFRKLKRFSELEKLANQLEAVFEETKSRQTANLNTKKYWIIKGGYFREKALYNRDLGKYSLAYKTIQIALEIYRDHQIYSLNLKTPLIETAADICINTIDFDIGFAQLVKILEIAEVDDENSLEALETKRLGRQKIGQLLKAHNKNVEGIAYLEESLEYEEVGTYSYILTKISILQAKSQLFRDYQINPELEFEQVLDFDLTTLITETQSLIDNLEELYTKSGQSIQYIDHLATAYHDLATLYYYNEEFTTAFEISTKSLEMKYNGGNHESILATLLLRFLINENLNTGNTELELTEIQETLSKIENPKKVIDATFSVSQFLINRSEFDRAEFFFEDSYNKLLEMRIKTSTSQNIRYEVTRRYFRLGFTWAFSRLNSSIQYPTCHIWDTLEKSQNIELSFLYNSTDSDTCESLNKLLDLDVKLNKKILIIGMVSDYIPGEQSRIIKLYESNLNDLQLSDFTPLPKYFFQDARYITHAEKIKELKDYVDLSDRLNRISKGLFQNSQPPSIDSHTLYSEIDMIILLPYGRLQKLPLEELLVRYFEQKNIKYHGTIVRALSIKSFYDSLETISNNAEPNSHAIIVDNPTKDPELQDNECKLLRDLCSSNSISVDYLDDSNSSKDVLLNLFGNTSQFGIIYHHCSHGKFPDDPTMQSIDVNNGSLTMVDFINLPNKLIIPSLASLATCESGTIQGGISSEILGLPVALTTLGFSTIISSLFEVETLISKKFYESLYKYLMEGNDTDLSLKLSIQVLKSQLTSSMTVGNFLSIIAWHHIGPPVNLISKGE